MSYILNSGKSKARGNPHYEYLLHLHKTAKHYRLHNIQCQSMGEKSIITWPKPAGKLNQKIAISYFSPPAISYFSPPPPKNPFLVWNWDTLLLFSLKWPFLGRFCQSLGNYIWVLAGVARAPQQQLDSAPGWVCRFRCLSRTQPLSPSSGFTSQTKSRLYYMDWFYPNSMIKSRAKKLGPFLPLTSCWTFFRSLCLVTSQLQPLTKYGCDRWLLTRRWHQKASSYLQG